MGQSLGLGTGSGPASEEGPVSYVVPSAQSASSTAPSAAPPGPPSSAASGGGPTGPYERPESEYHSLDGSHHQSGYMESSPELYSQQSNHKNYHRGEWQRGQRDVLAECL